MLNKQALRDLLDGDELRELADRYDAHPDVASPSAAAVRLQAYGKQLIAERFVMPIAGIQGSGKSTLLNALAFDTPVLPIDADETTCVPVEIAWSEQASPQAAVHYSDGRVETIRCTEDALRSFVHNDSNPGNTKQVARVVLRSNQEMLRRGLVLVDLPGVGSLTPANVETTRRYLSEAVGVIFMLRTVPPLTRSEAIFVALQWGSLHTARFVQNRWNDETDEEAHAGRDHNVRVLQQIAARAKIALDAPPTVQLVNGYDALRATFNQDSRLAESSGLAELRADLEQLGADWANQVVRDVLTAARLELTHLAKTIDGRISVAKLDRGQHQAHMEEQARSFKKQLADLDARADELRGHAREFQHQVQNRLRGWVHEKGAELRNSMRTKMRKGMVDGPRLQRALLDEQGEATDDIFKQVQEDALSLQDKLRTDLERLDAWEAEKKPDVRFSVDSPESTHFENLGGRIGGLAGGLGGGAGAVLLAGVLLSNPAGWVTLGALAAGSILGGLLGSWIGHKAKENVTELRARAIEGEVNAAIGNYVSDTADALNKIASDFCEKLGGMLDQWRAARVQAFEREQKSLLDALNLSGEEKARIAEQLDADSTKLAALRTRFEGLAA